MTNTKKHFVFTMTAGRTGTAYLAKLLEKNILDVEAHHEFLDFYKIGIDMPDLSDSTTFNTLGNTLKIKKFWRSKLTKILKSKAKHYIETSHLLMKTGLIENIDYLKGKGDVHLVVLKRDPLKVMSSFNNRLDFLNIGNIWLWYLDPNYPKNIVDFAPFRNSGIIGIRLWYLCEVEVRTEYYKIKTRSRRWIKVHEVDLADLNDKTKVRKFLDKLGVGEKSSTNIVIPEPQNLSSNNIKMDPEDKELLLKMMNSMRFDAKKLATSFIAHGQRLG